MYRKDRQKDFYTALARKEGYPARSVYKLKEIDEKYKVINKGDRVLDLGCAPGSWLLYVSRKVGSGGRVVGVDLEETKVPEIGNISFIRKSALDLKESDFKDKFEVVLSDLAPRTSGVKSLDAGKSLELAETAFKIAKSVLGPGGNFVCKVFESGESNLFFREVKSCFSVVKRFKPGAAPPESKEFYVIGKGFKAARSEADFGV